MSKTVSNRPYAWWRFADQFHHHASLSCSFCTLFPHFILVFFSIPVLSEHICILNVRLGCETDQQNVIMHKGYYCLCNKSLICYDNCINISCGLWYWFYRYNRKHFALGQRHSHRYTGGNIVIPGFCPIHLIITFAGQTKMDRYTGNVVIPKIVKPVFHCR